ncbi:MAG TPA: hypothetical protein VFY58_05135, partial [Nocardioides sp.]|nr:hypothetical protein [Nocardioides sp.]
RRPVTDPRAWGWVQHLRDGGTTAWADWTGTAEPGGGVVPGAQQLELLRLLNRAGDPTPRLVERVLGASAPGRGQPDLELVGAARESRFGPKPVDPATLPTDELLRVATGLLAEDVVARGAPEPPAPGRPRPWRRSYRLHGDPALVAPLRAHLVARGRPPGGRHPTHLVLATDLGRMLAHLWTARAFGGGVPGWSTWLRRLERHGALPRRINPLHLARTRTGHQPPGQVHIVLDPQALPSLVGLRRLPLQQDELAAEAPDLARRIGYVMGLLVPDDRRRALMHRTLRPWLAESPGQPVAVPTEHFEWLNDEASRLADGLNRAGYAVHGDLAGLAPVRRAGVEAPTPRATLALAVRMMLAGPSGAAVTEEDA